MKRSMLALTGWTATAVAACSLGLITVAALGDGLGTGPVAAAADLTAASSSFATTGADSFTAGRTVTDGGEVFASCDSGSPVVTAAPATGWTGFQADRRSDTEAEAFFSTGSGSTARWIEIHIACAAGGPTFTVESGTNDLATSSSSSASAASTAPTASDDHGGGVEPGDDNGGGAEPGDDIGGAGNGGNGGNEPGDDNGGARTTTSRSTTQSSETKASETKASETKGSGSKTSESKTSESKTSSTAPTTDDNSGSGRGSGGSGNGGSGDDSGKDDSGGHSGSDDN